MVDKTRGESSEEYSQAERRPQHEAPEFAAVLLDEQTRKPLAGYTVRAFDLDAGPDPVDLGTQTVDDSGRFVVRRKPPQKRSAEASGPARSWRLALTIVELKGGQ